MQNYNLLWKEGFIMISTMSKSVFISYRSSDGIDLPFNLYNFLKNEKIDVFFDRRERTNDEPIKTKVTMEVRERHNFIILLSVESIQKLIEHIRTKSLERDYVYEELSAAIQSHNNIIPVFFNEIDENNAKKIIKELFEEYLKMEDSYTYVFRKPGEGDAILFWKIFAQLQDKSTIRHVDLSGVYWVGTRESDMPEFKNGLGFKGAVLFFGKNSLENRIIMCEETSEQRVDHNDATDTEQDKFIEESITKIIMRDPEAKFMFYNPYTVYRLQLDEKYGADHFICLNDRSILEQVNNKCSFRELVKDIIPLLPITERTRTDCDYDDLLEAKERGEFEDNNDYGEDVPEIQFDNDLQFIVQAPVSSGGAGTFILNKKNAQFLLAALDKRAKYLVSIYHTNNISVNIHVIIYQNKIVYCPASIQIVREVSTENKLMYKGADFIAYKQIRSELREQFIRQVAKVAERLQQLGYRGVCGIDAIIHDGRVNILEVNGRFQASTELINRTVLRRGHKSIQELNYDAFFGTESDSISPETFYLDLNIPYSNYSFSYEGQLKHDVWIYNRALNHQHVEVVQADGYIPDLEKRYNAQAFLYRIVFNRSIVSINEDSNILMHENICGLDKWLVRKILSREKLAVKIAMMIQGINVEENLQNTLREATNNAIDLQIGKGEDLMIINSPTNIKFVEFSPFMLVSSSSVSDKYRILYYGENLLDNVDVFPADKNQYLSLKDGRHCYSEIAYLSTDRLRVHLTNACCFKQQTTKNGFDNNGCQFCNIKINHNPNPITEHDIEEVVKTYINDKREIEEQDLVSRTTVTLKHFLVGGQSLQNGNKELIETVKVLSKYKMPIYVMTLPLEKETVEELVKYGVLEYAYNIEIFNEECRKKYMPGKGQISAEDYISALIETRKILNRANFSAMRRVVRSMVVVGLEPYSDMITGIRKLIENDIEPMLSVFRPLPDTPLADMNAPPVGMIYRLFYTISTMLYEASSKNSIHFKKLGPKCNCCQNNTVSLPWNMQKHKEVHKIWCVDQAKENFER